jgi:hypothetical protein
MVVRALPDNFDDSAIFDSEQSSNALHSLTTNDMEQELLMEINQSIAPTHRK